MYYVLFEKGAKQLITAFLFSMLGYCILLSPLYILIRFIFIKRTRFHFLRELWYYSFFLYCVGIFSQTILPSREFLLGHESAVGRSNFTPFETIQFYLNQLGGPMHTVAVYNLVGNIVLFVPFGFYIPSIWHKLQSLWKMVVVSFTIPLFIETTQYFIGRSIDVDDVILNTLAIIIGYSLFYAYRRMFKAEKS